MIRVSRLILIFTALCIFPAALSAQISNARVLTLEDATRMVDAAHERAKQDNWNVAIVVVDAGGHMIYLRKMDDTQIASIEIAIKKARTSVFYKRPTKAFEDRIAEGNMSLLKIPDMLPFEGGLPVEYNGNIIGAIGVSGVTAQQDGIIALAGLNAL